VRFVKHDAVRLIAIKVATEISAMRCIFQRNSQESVDFPGPVIVRLRLDDGPLQVGTCLDRVCVYLLHEESRTSPRRRCADHLSRPVVDHDGPNAEPGFAIIGCHSCCCHSERIHAIGARFSKISRVDRRTMEKTCRNSQQPPNVVFDNQ
jgi:Fe-S-cluster containining protein